MIIVLKMLHQFVCISCGQAHPGSPFLLACRKCGGAMDLAPTSELNPIDPDVTMGEGNTPLIELSKTGVAIGCSSLFAKLEFLNPTGSFKDRGTATLISQLKAMNITRIAEDSSGNAGASIAAYSARAGIQATIFAPTSAPEAKLAQIAFYGADIRRIPGGRQASTEACLKFCNENDVVYASHNLSPYFIEGTKGMATEILNEMPSPKHILFPVGNGSLLIGSSKALDDTILKTPGQPKPRLHAVQSEECMPLVSLYTGKNMSRKTREHNATVAGGIAVEAPPRLYQCLEVLKKSDGTAVSVEEARIVHWQRRVADEDGVFIEPTSAAALAGLEKLLNQGVIKPTDNVLIPLTGFGLKDAIPTQI
ncbi:pyridoxal-phosphate dependent enzyme [SAR202 cluster bacterium AD-804-J14_MRT_500m]|nr:pyridoxal-phosphate dependent enzyme [SAR202 cluster bacterium AD-804-J14_MRT_500m]